MSMMSSYTMEVAYGWAGVTQSPHGTVRACSGMAAGEHRDKYDKTGPDGVILVRVYKVS